MKALLTLLLLVITSTTVAAQNLELQVERRIRVSAPGGDENTIWLWNWPANVDGFEEGSTLLVDGPPGDHRISVKGINLSIVDGNIKTETVYGTIILTIEGKPEPEPDPDNPPDPSPTIPTDEMGNLARFVAQQTALFKLQKRNQLAENYLTAMRRLDGVEEPIFRTIDESATWIGNENAKLGEPGDLVSWAKAIGPLWEQYVTDRTKAVRFYQLVALGLKG